MTAVRLTAYHPNGATLGPLPSPQDVSVSYPLNDLGALQFSYAANAPRVGVLGRPLEVAVEVTHDLGMTWVEPPSSRFLYYRDGRDPVKTADAWVVEGAPYILRLEKAIVGFRSLNSDGTRVFASQTPGAILGALFDEAKTRGALTGMTRTWGYNVDSSGKAWPEQINTLALEPGKNLLSVLQDLAGMGLVDFRTTGRNVDLFVAESLTGMGKDRTTEATPVVLRAGRDLLEAPFRRTWEALADTAIVHGDNGVNITRTNPNAVKPWGRQETYATASGVTDTGTLSVVGDTVLEGTADQRTEHTFGLDFRKTPHLPLRDYGPGEWVYAMTETESGNQVTRFRVMQVTLTKGQDGRAAGNVVLNDRFVHGDVRNARKLDRLLKGADTSGTGGPPTTSPGGNDILAPAKVGTLTAALSTYVNSEGRNRAQVTLDWADVTQNADGSSATDVDHYEIWRSAATGGWQMVGTTAVSIFYSSDYEPSSVWKFKVRAVDSVWNRGAFSSDHTITMPKDSVPPPRPSQPTVSTRLGVATVTWNGKPETNPAQGMGLDYVFTEYHVSATNNVNQDPSLTRIGDTRGQGAAVSGPLAYSTTHYAWVVAVDDNGNRSQASPVRSFAVAPLVDVSNFPDDAMETLYARTAHFITVTSDMIAANAIKAMHVDAGAISTDKLTVSSRKPSVLPNSWMEIVHPTVSTRPANWWVWYFSGTQPVISRNDWSPISGAVSMRITGDTTTGYTVGSDNGNWLPVLPGQTWTVRGHFRSTVGSVPAGKSVRLRFYTSAAGVNPIGFTGDRTYRDVVLTGPLAAGSTFILEETFTVPANHVQAAVAVVSDVIGTAFGHDWDGVELAPGVSDGDVTTIGAGKISTGILQATTRVIAGVEGGARAEMAGTGWAAYAADGSTKTFEVKASDGSVFTSGTFTTMASAGTGRVQISAVQNPYELNQTWNTIQFFSSNTSWAAGMVWAAYGTGSPNWGALQLVSPRLGTRQPAKITLRSEEQTNATAIHLTANEIRATADNYYWGDPTSGVTSFWLPYTASAFQRFNFLNSNGKRVQFRFEEPGVNVLASLFDASTLNGLTFRARDFRWQIEGSPQDLFLGRAPQASYRPILIADGGGANAGLVFGLDALHVMTLNGSDYMPIEASAFTVRPSDSRLKENVHEAPRALEVVESVPVYTYDVTGAATDQIGLMAQDLQVYLPEAVRENEKGELGLSISPLLATVWGAIQDLTAEVRTMSESPIWNHQEN